MSNIKTSFTEYLKKQIINENYKELEFVCHNSNYKNSSNKKNQADFYNQLKKLEIETNYGIKPYMQDFCDDDHEEFSLAVIIIDKNKEQELERKIKKIANRYNIKFDLYNQRNSYQTDSIIKNNYYDNILESNINIINYDHPNFIDGKIFKREGGRLIIARYSKNMPYSVIEIFVDENKRRVGIAKSLMIEALNYFKKGFVAQSSNIGSLKLAYKLGFRSFNSNLKLETYEVSKQRLETNTSVNMASPTLIPYLNEYY